MWLRRWWKSAANEGSGHHSSHPTTVINLVIHPGCGSSLVACSYGKSIHYMSIRDHPRRSIASEWSRIVACSAVLLY